MIVAMGLCSLPSSIGSKRHAKRYCCLTFGDPKGGRLQLLQPLFKFGEALGCHREEAAIDCVLAGDGYRTLAERGIELAGIANTNTGTGARDVRTFGFFLNWPNRSSLLDGSFV
jgi:hypothetical protein